MRAKIPREPINLIRRLPVLLHPPPNKLGVRFLRASPSMLTGPSREMAYAMLARHKKQGQGHGG